MSGNMNFGTTRMTKEEFNQCANIKTIIKNITIAAIITYVIGAISLITNVILGGNIFGLLDVIIVIGLGVVLIASICYNFFKSLSIFLIYISCIRIVLIFCYLGIL